MRCELQRALFWRPRNIVYFGLFTVVRVDAHHSEIATLCGNAKLNVGEAVTTLPCAEWWVLTLDVDNAVHTLRPGSLMEPPAYRMLRTTASGRGLRSGQ